MGSNGAAPCSAVMLGRSASARRSTMCVSNKPPNMLPFTKPAGKPNIFLRSARGSSGNASSKVFSKSGGDFCIFIGMN
jgi:hypothetical protein